MKDYLGKEILIDGMIYEVLGVNMMTGELMTIKGNLYAGEIEIIDALEVEEKREDGIVYLAH